MPEVIEVQSAFSTSDLYSSSDMVCCRRLSSAMRCKRKWRLFAIIVIVGYTGTFIAFMSLSLGDRSGFKTTNEPTEPHVDRNKTKGIVNDNKRKDSDIKHGPESNKPLLWQIVSRIKHTSEVAWTTVRPLHLYVYSAHYDPRQLSIVVIGLVDRSRASTSVKCALWSDAQPEWPTISKAVVSVLPDTRDAKFVPCLVKCLLPANSIIPDHVSVYARADKLEKWQIEATNHILPVLPHATTEDDTRQYKFTVCVSLLRDDITANQLVEFIEVNRLFHADHFVVYDSFSHISNTSSPLQPYIQLYRYQGLVTVLPWTLPYEVTNKTNNKAQLGALNECLYRNMFVSKFLVQVDIDEIIVPMYTKSWTELLRHKKLQTSFNTTGCYSFQCVFFKTEWPSDDEFAGDSVVEKYNIQTLLKTHREKKVYRHRDRSKLFLIPERVSKVGYNVVHTFINKTYKAVNVPYSQAMVFHYKNWGEPYKPMEVDEKRMHSFSAGIVTRIRNVHQLVQGQL